MATRKKKVAVKRASASKRPKRGSKAKRVILAEFVVSIVQSFVTVSSRWLPYPGHNSWTDQAMRQGFSWRRGNVSFRVNEDAGDVPFEVAMADTLQVSPGAFRAIVVPFEAAKGGIEICDMYYASVHPIELPEGHYALLFEMEYRNPSPEIESSEDKPVRCRVTFVPSEDVSAAILKKDSELRPPKSLALDGQRASPDRRLTELLEGRSADDQGAAARRNAALAPLDELLDALDLEPLGEWALLHITYELTQRGAEIIAPIAARLVARPTRPATYGLTEALIGLLSREPDAAGSAIVRALIGGGEAALRAGASSRSAGTYVIQLAGCAQIIERPLPEARPLALAFLERAQGEAEPDHFAVGEAAFLVK
ncbi:competence protein ComJ [Hyalangium rubrum]|uniref:Competence protein ComJ n=1 Tax=Hyalangium rubrum TaxID=3103134 RepID=A0ABU5HHH1_9BACT|nr:competence protein ComJ [Hyalangium sp. s54d21]MDY7232910.1 competence protein ComJ [Hyalangium sp. s54d21]